MAGEDLVERIETVLGEFRIIVPAPGALLGFQLIVAFQDGYAALPLAMRAANFAAVVSTATALALLLIPPSYHRFTRGLEESEGFLRFAQRMVGLAFVFIASSLGLSIGLQATRSFGSGGWGFLAGAAAMALLTVAWWLVPRARAQREGGSPCAREEPAPERGAHKT